MSEDLKNQLKQLADRISKSKDQIQTEEATKMSFIIPFFQILGYDVFNPSEFVPEFTADVGIKKGEKVDYAIMENNKPIILIEAKWCGERLEKHDSQLFRYFGTTKAKFAILTNGLNYRFYTDLEEPNKLDEKPFLDINMLDLKDSQINELNKFKKDTFNLDEIFNSASELKYTSIITNVLSTQLSAPSDAFIKYLLSEFYDGVKTQNVVDKFRDIIKKSFTQFVNELINERLKTALNNEKADKEQIVATVNDNSIETTNLESKIITTEAEIQSFYIIKSILMNIIPLDKITYKDTESYFNILYDNKRTKWICRLKLSDSRKAIMFPDSITKETKYIETLDDLYKLKDELIQSAEQFIEKQ